MENNEYTQDEIELLNQDITDYYGYAKLPKNQVWHRWENGKIRVLTKEEVSEMKQKLRNKN